MSFENTLNEVLEKIKKTEDYNSEKFNVEYAIVSFLTNKECPVAMIAHDIIVSLSSDDKFMIDRVKYLIDDYCENKANQEK